MNNFNCRFCLYILTFLFPLAFFSSPILADNQSATLKQATPLTHQAAIASAHPLATEAGLNILKQGGNAFDAAIAVTAVLAVVEPYSSGIGGGGFWLLHDAKSGRDIMLDGRERAPFRAHRDMYLDAKGNVIPAASITGPLAAGIPGVPAAIDHLAHKYGQLTLAKSLAPAIDIARHGFPVDEFYQRMARFRLDDLRLDETASNIFLKHSQLPEVGDLIKQPELAATLESIAQSGKQGFYEGLLAWKLVKSVRKNGGIWTMKDLASYKVIERTPDVAIYKGMKLVTATLPSSGGPALSEMLNILSAFDIESLPEVQRVHLIVEAMRRAYRDRAEYMGDTDYVDVPIDYLLSEKHIQALVAGINKTQATPSDTLKALPPPTGAGTDTTHFSIIDQFGNRVSATLSINYPFGSCFVAAGTGVLLNDEMDDFSAKPGVPNVYGLVGGDANAIEPGKRMLSSMSPSFIETKDRVAVLGTPGGSRIITMVLLGILDFFNGADAEHIVNLGRFHHQYLPDKIFFEPDVFDENLITSLQDIGHELEELSADYGNMQVVIMNKKTGVMDAASDKRGIGKASIWTP